MAHAPASKLCHANLCQNTTIKKTTCPGRRKMALVRQRLRHAAPQDLAKHTLLLLEGSPFQHSGSTMLSLPLTTRPSNLRIQHCNRMVQKWFQLEHTHLPAAQGNPCRELCNTTLSWVHSIPPANSRIRQHNCMGPPGLVARLESLVARLAPTVARWARTHDGGPCNTTPFYQLPRCLLHPQRN